MAKTDKNRTSTIPKKVYERELLRLQEELVGIGGKTAVGRTPNVTGSITINGTTVPKGTFDVDMASIVDLRILRSICRGCQTA